MSFYPKNPALGQQLQGPGGNLDRAFLAHLALTAAQAAAADVDAVLAAQGGGQAWDLTTGLTNPPAARNVTATAGGTATDIKAIQVIVTGTNLAGEVITETLPAFTVDTAGTVVGSKAFATVTRVQIPAHDGAGATTSVGFGDKIGLPFKLSHNTVIPGMTFVNNVREGTEPTVAVSSTLLESNTIDPNSALAGTPVDCYFVV